MNEISSVWAEICEAIKNFIEWFAATGLPRETVDVFFKFLKGDLMALIQDYINVFFG